MILRLAFIVLLLAIPADAKTIRIDCEAVAKMMDDRPALWRFASWQALAEFCGIPRPVYAQQNDKRAFVVDREIEASEPVVEAVKPERRVGKKPSTKPGRRLGQL